MYSYHIFTFRRPGLCAIQYLLVHTLYIRFMYKYCTVLHSYTVLCIQNRFVGRPAGTTLRRACRWRTCECTSACGSRASNRTAPSRSCRRTATSSCSATASTLGTRSRPFGSRPSSSTIATRASSTCSRCSTPGIAKLLHYIVLYARSLWRGPKATELNKYLRLCAPNFRTQFYSTQTKAYSIFLKYLQNISSLTLRYNENKMMIFKCCWLPYIFYFRNFA